MKFHPAHLVLPHKHNKHRAHLLKPVALNTMIAFVLGLQLFFSLLGRMNPEVLGMAHSITPGDIITLTNDERGKVGLPALGTNGQLMVAAQKKGEDMLAKGYWAHVSPDGRQPWAFIREAGYSYERAGENLAKDFTDSTSAMRAWMNSPGHKANIVNVYYGEIGVSVVSGVMNGRDTVIVVQMFGQPRGGNVAQILQNPQAAQAQIQTPPTPAPKGVSVVADLGKNTQITDASRPTGAQIPADSLRLEPIDQPEQPLINPFQVSRTVMFVIAGIVLTLLVADIIMVARGRIKREHHGHSTLHAVFIIFMLIVLLISGSGAIL